TYEDFINREVKLINSDGCTGVTNLHPFCCKVHDLEYFYRVSAIDAFKAKSEGYKNFWKVAKPISRSEADNHFRRCLHSKSFLGYLSPLSYLRWLGVRLFGRWRERKNQL